MTFSIRFYSFPDRACVNEIFINKPPQTEAMEFKVLEESKTRLRFELTGETHTFCNALKHELQAVKGITLASYKIDHPLIGVPQFLIETKGIEPRKALPEALSSLKKKTKEFQKEVAEL